MPGRARRKHMRETELPGDGRDDTKRMLDRRAERLARTTVSQTLFDSWRHVHADSLAWGRRRVELGRALPFAHARARPWASTRVRFRAHVRARGAQASARARRRACASVNASVCVRKRESECVRAQA
eukprot:1971128-Pleurochrysis_carterae.AAC.2